jgi:hypoxanthine phosphoribosyltransferase
MRHLTWTDFDEAVYRLANAFEGRAFNGVYGFPRGGLPLAVALSHRLGLPLLEEIEPDCLVVDDVYETGRTLEPALEYEGVECAVWISKVSPTWFKAAEVVSTDEWLIFPWENPANAAADEDDYRASRE